MAELVELTDATFESTTQSGVVLVDFWAPWCGPCQMQTPILHELAGKTEATIGKMNVDENTDVAGRFGVQSIPTLIVLKDGKEVQRFVGLQQEDALLDALSKA